MRYKLKIIDKETKNLSHFLSSILILFAVFWSI